MKSCSRRWLAGPLLALAVLGAGMAVLSLRAQDPGGGAAPPGPVPPPGAAGPATPPPGKPAATAGDLLTHSRNVPGDAKPIVIDADEVHTWAEDGLVAILLKGSVLVQQSVVQARFQQGVAWVDLARYKATGVLHMDLYAEGQVRLDTSGEIRDGARAKLSISTRGEFRLRSLRSKVQRQPRLADPLVARARPLVPSAARSPASTGIVPAVREVPAPVPPPPVGGPRQTSSLPLPGARPAADELILAQATASPGPGPSTPPPGSMPPPGSGPSEPPREGGMPPPVPPPVPLPNPPDPGPMPPGGDPGGVRPPLASPPGPAVGPARPLPLPLPPPSTPAAPPPAPPLPRSNLPRQHRLLPRSGGDFDFRRDEIAPGQSVITVTRGVILNVRNVPGIGMLDVEADRAVVWVRGRDADQTARDLRSAQGDSSQELEFYMAGHVILRAQSAGGRERTVLTCDELYYDTNRNVAIALNARLEINTNRFASRQVQITEPLVLNAREILRTSATTYETGPAEVFSSKLPSDPGLKLVVSGSTVEERKRLQTTLFGEPVIDPKTGRQREVPQSILRARNVRAELLDVPFLYVPYLVTDARDPLGPLESIVLGGNSIFGFQGGVGLNVYKLFGMLPYEGTRWRLLLDYLSRRGPAGGTNFDFGGALGPSALDPDVVSAYEGTLRLYGVYDHATDILGGVRPQMFQPDGGRGRAFWRGAAYDLPYGFSVQSQTSWLSDRNFLEQYFKREFDTEPNQATFTYLKQQQGNMAWSGFVQGQVNPWITTTEWLPRLDGYVLGQDLFGLLTSNTQVSLAYARLRVSDDPAVPLQGVTPATFSRYTTEQDATAGRFALLQELSLPFTAGALRIVPYVKGALVEYTSDLSGNEIGRAWGGGGARVSVPFTRLYPDVCSELLNVQGINHKIVLSGNYFVARSNESYSRFAQFDRLHDDASQQMLREFTPYQPIFNTGAGFRLATSPLYDPQRFAIRRLIDNRIDTLDQIQVVQADLLQRWQTKRGYPGAEHIVDWMVLDTSLSYFPDASRDNFGKPFGFLEYTYIWNIGDRTTLESTGWYDPQEQGPKVFTVGAFFNRPDRTNFYVGYRQIDPLQSRMVTGAVTYVFSAKYSMTAVVSYDFGVSEALTNSILFTRTGTDLQVTLGVTYNSLNNNLGAVVEIVPNLLPINRRGAGGLTTGPGGLLTR